MFIPILGYICGEFITETKFIRKNIHCMRVFFLKYENSNELSLIRWEMYFFLRVTLEISILINGLV